MGDNNMAIDARMAAKSAAQYYEDISGERTKLSIEEIEMNDDGHFWLITLGISDPYSIGMNSKPREYKIFQIDANTGEVKSMKIRKV